jgi:hypothetical protein
MDEQAETRFAKPLQARLSLICGLVAHHSRKGGEPCGWW